MKKKKKDRRFHLALMEVLYKDPTMSVSVFFSVCTCTRTAICCGRMLDLVCNQVGFGGDKNSFNFV